MFIILLKFSDNKENAGQFMDGHNAWVKNGFDEKVFLIVGSIQLNKGGGVIAHNTTFSELQDRVNKDPFVAENVVTAEIIEISPAVADERLQFLCE